MIMNLKTTPYSYRGSYMAFSEIPSMFNGMLPVKEGLYFRSIHGSSKTSMVAKITPSYEVENVSYSTEVKPSRMTIRTDVGETNITFVDAKTILI